MPSGVGPCGIGSSQNASGECIGSYGGVSALAHLADGLNVAGPVAGIVGIGACVVSILFAVFAINAIRGVFERRKRAREAQAREDRLAERRLYRRYYREFDFVEFGRRLGDGDDELSREVKEEREEDREVDREDDEEDDDGLGDAGFAEEGK